MRYKRRGTRAVDGGIADRPLGNIVGANRWPCGTCRSLAPGTVGAEVTSRGDLLP
jgi:hypothetical protein